MARRPLSTVCALRRARSSAAFRAILGAILIAGSPLAAARPATAAADSPTVTPATGGGGVPVVVGTFEEPEAIGYDTAEYFLEGDAHSYTTGTPLTPDGRWDDVAPNPTTAHYKTRAIVHMPKNRHRFTGTVYVEWLNVSGLADASPDWVHGHLQVARQGAAYVLASAQIIGVNWLKCGTPPCPAPLPGDADRYASLVHPGDSYSYDIFSQIGQAVRDGALVHGRVRRVIAMGESQSAGRMATYIDAVHPLVRVYDGFVVHSRFPGGGPLSQAPLPQIPVRLADIRSDIDTPVIGFQTESDQAGGRLRVRQPETSDGNYRLWEVAGTSHFDEYGLTIGGFDVGDGEAEVANLEALQDPDPTPTPGIIECREGINAGPMHWVFDAAVYWIERWVARGTPPPIAPRLEATSAPGDPVVFEHDEHGNVLGGIRTPIVDVPIATLTGTGNGPAPGAPPTSQFCSLFGQTVPFTEEELGALYPNHLSFVLQYLFASLEAVHSRYLLWPDALALVRAAALSDIGR